MKPILLRDVKGVFRQIPKSNLPHRLVVIESHKDIWIAGGVSFVIGILVTMVIQTILK